MYEFLVENIYLQFLLMNFSRSKLKIVNNTKGQNTSKYCSQIFVGHVVANGFL